jgi:hypothetical protein
MEAIVAIADPDTGEVLEDEPSRRRRTPEEVAAAKRICEERAAYRRQEVAALRAIDPACEVEGDPPVAWRVPRRMGGEPRGVLLEVPRLSGRALPGSCLVLAARSYDGCGPNGGEAHDHVTAFIRFRDSRGYERRSMGVSIHASELREVARVLLEHASELDGRNADAEERIR